MYRAEESTHRLNRATELPPRLRQTLECLLAGDTERQVALKLSLSVHTVHDYVKALYTHFGVSSRGELLSKWMQTSGQLPPRRD
jgi:DNA-binding NarL/FixJ family response regulator